MKKLIVDDSVCIGCGMCAASDPEHFTINDNGLSEVISQENLESDNLKNMVDSCPVSAIKLAEADNDIAKDNTISFNNAGEEEEMQAAA